MTNQRDGGWWGRVRGKLSRGAEPQDDTGITGSGSDRLASRMKLEEWAAGHERPAWRPVAADAGDSTAISRFGGAPWVLDGENVPNCEVCGRDLQLFLQLELSSLPAESAAAKGDGVLQLFYCRGGWDSDKHDDCWGEGGWEPFSTKVQLTRVVPAGELVEANPNSGEEPPWPPRVITGWERFADRPDPEDHAALGLRTTYDFKAKTVFHQADDVGVAERFGLDELPVDQISMAVSGDKLGGWPRWMQEADYPRCNVCDETMEVIFQLDSEDHVPYVFGEYGVGHISLCRSLCRSHSDVAAFGWACI